MSGIAPDPTSGSQKLPHDNNEAEQLLQATLSAMHDMHVNVDYCVRALSLHR